MNKKQAANGLTGLFFILVIVIALILIVRGCGSGGNVLDDLPDTLPTEPIDSAEPSDEPSPSPSPSESPTPSPSEEPTPTPAPEISSSGTIKSDTGVGLNVIAEWHAVSAGDGKISLTVDMYIDSYSINVNAAPGSAVFTVGGKTLSANVSKLDVVAPDKTVKTLIASQTFTVDGGATPISAKWMFGGTYSGKDFDFIEAAGTADIS